MECDPGKYLLNELLFESFAVEHDLVHELQYIPMTIGGRTIFSPGVAGKSLGRPSGMIPHQNTLVRLGEVLELVQEID